MNTTFGYIRITLVAMSFFFAFSMFNILLIAYLYILYSLYCLSPFYQHLYRTASLANMTF